MGILTQLRTAFTVRVQRAVWSVDQAVENLLDRAPAAIVPVPARGWSARKATWPFPQTRLRWSRGICSVCNAGEVVHHKNGVRYVWGRYVRLYRNAWGGCAICFDCWSRRAG